jgi:hypothetical protein
MLVLGCVLWDSKSDEMYNSAKRLKKGDGGQGERRRHLSLSRHGAVLRKLV